jgi:hypothetical protein
MRIPGCEECARLWEKYTAATFDFVKLDSQVKMAALQYESSMVMARMDEEVVVVAQRRDTALKCLRQHEASHQTRTRAAAT